MNQVLELLDVEIHKELKYIKDEDKFSGGIRQVRMLNDMLTLWFNLCEFKRKKEAHKAITTESVVVYADTNASGLFQSHVEPLRSPTGAQAEY